MSKNATGQSETVLDTVEHIPGPEEAGMSPEAPRVPFASHLQLTREQEDRLIEHCIDRLDSMEQESGRDMCSAADWYSVPESREKGARSFLGKRQLYESVYYNDVEWRAGVLGGIFEKSNFVAPIARRIAKQMIARANNYFFGSEPWFAASPLGRTAQNRDLAEKIEHFCRYKLHESGSVHDKRRGIELAFVRGESVVKTVHKRDEDIYETEADILIDEFEDPILDSMGGYIFEQDRWVDEMLIDETTGEESPSGRQVLERDPDTPAPDAMMFQTRKIKQRTVIYDGPDSQPVYYKDFLCPLTASDVQDADCVVHLYDVDWMKLADTYRRKDVIGGADSMADRESAEATIRAVNLLRELAVNDNRAKSARNSSVRSDDEDGLQDAARDSGNDDPVIEAAEFWVKFDANEDGVVEHIMVVIDRNSQVPIFYDYVANITPDGRRPFSVFRPTEVDGRWYGIGAMEMFESAQEIIDLLVNRWNLANSESGRVTFWNPAATYQGDSDPNLKLKWGGTYTLKPNMKPEDALGVVYLQNTDHNQIKDMFEFFLQIAMNESGVQHANDANAAGLDQAKLATGIRNIEKSGQEMFGVYISSLERGIADAVKREADIILANMDKTELFDFFDGEATQLMEITPQEVRDVSVNVTMLLTRYKGEQLLAQASAGVDFVDRFYGMPYIQQVQTATFFRMIIRALDLPVDPDQVIQPIEMPMEGGGGGGNPDRAIEAAKSVPQRQSEPNL
jgi:hypothetical protein